MVNNFSQMTATRSLRPYRYMSIDGSEHCERNKLVAERIHPSFIKWIKIRSSNLLELTSLYLWTGKLKGKSQLLSDVLPLRHLMREEYSNFCLRVLRSIRFDLQCLWSKQSKKCHLRRSRLISESGNSWQGLLIEVISLLKSTTQNAISEYDSLHWFN